MFSFGILEVQSNNHEEQIMKSITINVHIEKEAKSFTDIERRHYTVGQLIAELQQYEKSVEIVVLNMNNGSYGSLDFMGVTPNPLTPKDKATV